MNFNDIFRELDCLRRLNGMLQLDNNLLRQQNIRLQEDVIKSQTKLDKCTILQERNRNIANNDIGQTNVKKSKEKPSRKSRTLKPYSELKHSARALGKKQIEDKIKAVADEYPDVTSLKVELNYSNGQVMEFSSSTENGKEESSRLTKLQNEGDLPYLDSIQKVLIIKDKYRISNAAIHELHMIGKVLPSLSALDKEKKRLTTTLLIHTLPGKGVDCTTRKADDILQYVLVQPLHEKLIKSDDPIVLRFSCDGAKLSKKLNSVRAVFKILEPRKSLPDNMSQLSMSPEDEYTLFFFIGEENKYSLKRYGKTSFEEMKTISQNGIELFDKKIPVQWVMSCDWKALALLKGINSANSNYFCLWCHCNKQQIYDFSIPSWPIQRSPEEQLKSLPNCDLGYISEDLIPFVDYTDIIPDDLHMRIRISMKLFNQVVTWEIDQKVEQELETELKRIGVPFHFWEERGDGKSSLSVKKWSQPSGDELKIIIKDLQIHNVLENKNDRHLVSVESLPYSQLKEELTTRGLSSKGKKVQLVERLKDAVGNSSLVKKQKISRSRLQVFDFNDDDDADRNSLDVEGLQQLWSDFDELMESIREMPSSEKYKCGKDFSKLARQWAVNFRKLTFDEDVTPYIHAMVYHVPYFLDKFRYIHDIGVSQVERKNYDHRQAYFGSTNRNGGFNPKKISQQIIERENRLLWARFAGVERKKRKYIRNVE